MLEGFIHISEIGSDFYNYDDFAKTLVGEYRGERYIAGDKIFVTLKTIDFITLECAWVMARQDKQGKRRGKARFSK